MKQAIELTQEELELIKEQREKAAEQKRLKEQEQARIKAQEDEKLNGKKRLQNILVEADTNNLIKRDFNGELYFMIDDVQRSINIEEHIVDNKPGWYSKPTNHGWKFKIDHPFEYRTKWMKNPQTVLKNINDWIETDQRKKEQEQNHLTLKRKTLDLLRTKYQDAAIQDLDIYNRSSTFKITKGSSTVYVASSMKSDGEINITITDVTLPQDKQQSVLDFIFKGEQ